MRINCKKRAIKDHFLIAQQWVFGSSKCKFLQFLLMFTYMSRISFVISYINRIQLLIFSIFWVVKRIAEMKNFAVYSRFLLIVILIAIYPEISGRHLKCTCRTKSQNLPNFENVIYQQIPKPVERSEIQLEPAMWAILGEIPETQIAGKESFYILKKFGKKILTTFKSSCCSENEISTDVITVKEGPRIINRPRRPHIPFE